MRPPVGPRPTDAADSWVAEVREAYWGDRSRFEFGGWAYVLGDPRSCSARTRVQVVFESVGVPPVLATTDRRVDPEVNVGSNDPNVDWAPAGFTARLDLSELIERLPAGDATMKWTARVELADAEWSAGGRMTKRYRWGSAGEMSTEGFPDDIHIQPGWSDEDGLALTVARRALVADTVELHGRTLTGTIRANGRFVPDSVLLAYRGSDRQVVVAVDAEGPRTRFRVDVPEAGVADALPTLAYLYGVDSAGRRRHVHWTRGRGVEYDSAGDRAGLFIRRGASGVIRVEEHRSAALVDSIECTDDEMPVLEVSGRGAGGARPVGCDAARPSPDRSGVGGSGGGRAILGDISLVVDDGWGNDGLAPRPGDTASASLDTLGRRPRHDCHSPSSRHFRARSSPLASGCGSNALVRTC